MMRRYFLILGALCFIGIGQADAQLVTYEGGSVYDLDPKASQTTGNAILERVLNSNDMQPVNEMAEGDILRRLSRPVGRLALGLSGGKVSYCTASLIDKDHILTNYHCVPGKGNVREALLWMGYLVPRSRRGVAQYGVELRPVEANKKLDYVILKVKGTPGAEWGHVPLSSGKPGARSSLFVVHHPGGFAKYISRGRCQTSDPAIDGDDVLHICDTLGGSSGAPIFDNNSRKVIGLHYSAVGLRDLNAGKRIASIAKDSKIIARILTDAAPKSAVPKKSDETAALRKRLAAIEAELKAAKTKSRSNNEKPSSGRSSGKAKPDDKKGTQKAAIIKSPKPMQPAAKPSKTRVSVLNKIPRSNVQPISRTISWKLPLTVPSTLEVLGSLATDLKKELASVSQNKFRIKLYEPGELFSAFDVFDAVKNGSVEAAWSIPYYWYGRNKAFSIFGGSVPFGLPANKFAAWLTDTGAEQLDGLYYQYNIKSLPCGLMGPEGGGWYRQPITSPDDFKGLKIRFAGVGGQVIQKLGATVVLLPGGQIYPALERGVIDGTEYSAPFIDHAFGFHNILKNYYYPGWHSPVTLLEVIINRDVWNSLSLAEQSVLQTACWNNFSRSLLAIPQRQKKGVDALRAEGVRIRPFPNSVLESLKAAADQFFEEQESASVDFKRAYDSYNSYR